MPPLRPFWRYFGAKWRLAPLYPPPQFPDLVEPFAGAAGYALHYPDRRVLLVDKYEAIVGVWSFLIRSSAANILAIPLVDHLDDLPTSTCQEARDLVGFNLATAVTSPRTTISVGCRKFRDAGKIYGWCERMRTRVASQVDAIKHWRVALGDYTTADALAPDVATRFVDPPYVNQGRHYVHSSRHLDYATLAAWCLTKPGQTIACEAQGASWLPFRDLAPPRQGNPRSRGVREAMWTNA